MSNTHEVISAFLDDEPFDPQELERALSDSEGRAQLIDSLALRHVMQPGREAMSAMRPKRNSGLRAVLAAAAVVLALVGGYALGQRQSESGRAEAPPATRVLEAPAAWQQLPSGGL
jgi:hypothetical protein